MYSDLGNLSNLTPVILWFGKIDAGFFKEFMPNPTISRQRLGDSGACWYHRGHNLFVCRGEVVGHIDMSMEKVDTHSESEQIKMDQSHAVSKAEEKKLFNVQLHSLFFY